MSASVCVCLFFCKHISRTTRTIFTKVFMHVAYRRGSVLLQRRDKIPRGRGNFDVFPTDNALCNVAFGTHTKTAEPIEMHYGWMTRLGSRYHVLDGGHNPPSEGAIIWEKVAAHCKVMGHSKLRCAKTAKSIDMPFWTKTRLGPRNHVLDGGADPPCRRGNFRDYPGIQKHWQSSLQPAASRLRSLQKGSFNRQ